MPSLASLTAAELDQRLQSTPSPLALLERSAAAHPDRPALEYLADDLAAPPRVLTYGQLLRDVRSAAAFFRTAGLGPRESVAILLPFVPQAVTALIAASAVATAFPVNLLLSAEALRAQLDLARCALVLSLGAHPQLDVRQRLQQALEGSAVKVLEVQLPADVGRPWPDSHVALDQADADGIGALVHTGGTTGQPKLARLSRRNMAAGALMAAAGLDLREGDRILTGLPLFHVGGAIDALLAGLAVGATLVFPTLLGMRNRAVTETIWPLVDRQRINLLAGVPTSLATLADSPLHGAHLGSLRALMTGGSPLPRKLAARLEEKTGKPICQLYGMTETSGIASARPTSASRAEQSVGRPMPLARLRLGTTDYQPGAEGEVFIAGPQVFQGYLTADGVVGLPEDGWFPSGDLGRVTAEGELRIVGRAKDVIIRSGHNIDPQLIEDTALAHPGIAQAAAVGMPDAYAGEVPVLFAVLRPGAIADADAIARFVQQRIAEPPARPRQVFLLPELPLTPFAKVARFRLRQLAVEHCARLAVAGLAEDLEVRCHDPAARRVTLRAAQPLSAVRQQAIRQALARLDLEVDPMA